VVSKAEALAWLRLEEARVALQIGWIQVGFPFQEVEEEVVLHRTVLEVPSGVVPPVFPVLV
jgi:hypothetical protein